MSVAITLIQRPAKGSSTVHLHHALQRLRARPQSNICFSISASVHRPRRLPTFLSGNVSVSLKGFFSLLLASTWYSSQACLFARTHLPVYSLFSFLDNP